MRSDMKLLVRSTNGLVTRVVFADYLEPPVISLNLDYKLNEIPIAQVELEVPYTEIEGEVRVYLHPETVRLLKAAGWTPPTEEKDNE